MIGDDAVDALLTVVIFFGFAFFFAGLIYIVANLAEWIAAAISRMKERPWKL